MGSDFKNLVAYFILAIAEEKCGSQEQATRYWEKIRCAGDVIDAVASTTPEGLFEEE